MDRIEKIRTIIDELLNKQSDKELARCGFVHLYGVAQLCSLLALKRGLDVEIANTIGMLHDIRSYKTGDPTNHARLGSGEAKKILIECDSYTEPEISVISKAISAHSNKPDIGDPYDELIKDADVLQHYLYNPSAVKEDEKPRLYKTLEELGCNLIGRE